MLKLFTPGRTGKPFGWATEIFLIKWGGEDAEIWLFTIFVPPACKLVLWLHSVVLAVENNQSAEILCPCPFSLAVSLILYGVVTSAVGHQGNPPTLRSSSIAWVTSWRPVYSTAMAQRSWHGLIRSPSSLKELTKISIQSSTFIFWKKEICRVFMVSEILIFN